MLRSVQDPAGPVATYARHVACSTRLWRGLGPTRAACSSSPFESGFSFGVFCFQPRLDTTLTPVRLTYLCWREPPAWPVAYTLVRHWCDKTRLEDCIYKRDGQVRHRQETGHHPRSYWEAR